MDSLLWELYGAGSNEDEVSVILRLKQSDAPPKNARVVSVFKNPSGEAIVTARIKRGDIRQVWASPEVVSVKAPRALAWPSPLDDSIAFEESESLLGSSWPYRQSQESIPEDGTGVVVGIPDYGFDFTHENFRNEDGTTRLLALWNQNSEDGPAPSPYGYGQVFYRDTINAALETSDPCKTLGYHPAMGDPRDNGSHGTHVADILAGNRRTPGSEVGLASGADLVFVHLARRRLGELANFGDSVCLLEALDFCRRIAGDRPCVINLSAGMCGGPHSDKLPFTKAVDAMVTERPGLAFVQSVGNYANTGMHIHFRLGPNRRRVLHWLISKRDRTPNELEIWYDGRDVIGLTLIAPGGKRFTVPLGKRVRLTDRGTHFGNLYHRRNEPNTGMNHIDIFLYTSAPKGHWRVALQGQQILDGRLHAWIERDASGLHQSRFARRQATSSYTTNTIANGGLAIAVGAHDDRRRATVFSSRGPTSDGRLKPEISAPGYRIKAARSLPREGWQGENRHCVKSGTSMAAPSVSGTVALMMQAAGRPMTIHEVRNILISTADPLHGRSGRTSTRFGYGYLNPAAAIAAARRLNAINAVADRDDEQADVNDNAFWKGNRHLKQDGCEIATESQEELRDCELEQYAIAAELENELQDPEQEEFEIAEEIEEEPQEFEQDQSTIVQETEDDLQDPEQEEFEIAEDLEEETDEELAGTVYQEHEEIAADEELAEDVHEGVEEIAENEELAESFDEVVEETAADEELAESFDEVVEETAADEELAESFDEVVEEAAAGEELALAEIYDQEVEEIAEDEELAETSSENRAGVIDSEEAAESVDEEVEGDIDDEEQEARSLGEVYELLDDLAEQEWAED